MGHETPAWVVSSSEERSHMTIYSGIYQRCQKETEPVFSHLTWCISFFLLDKHSPVRTSGLKPSTLKQLGQSVLQPPTAEELKLHSAVTSTASQVKVVEVKPDIFPSYKYSCTVTLVRIFLIVWLLPWGVSSPGWECSGTSVLLTCTNTSHF